jgi:hypothetical protein
MLLSTPHDHDVTVVLALKNASPAFAPPVSVTMRAWEAEFVLSVLETSNSLKAPAVAVVKVKFPERLDPAVTALAEFDNKSVPAPVVAG